MEYQQNRPGPDRQNNAGPMTPQSYGKRMWHIWGPLVIKWGIGFLTAMAAGVAVYLINIAANPEFMMKAMENQEQAAKLYDELTAQIMKVGTAMQGVAAFITIPVMIVFFHKDRIREKIARIIPNKKAPVWKYGAVIMMSVALSFGINNLMAISGITKVSEAYEETMKIFYTPSLPVQIICLAVLAPVCEELVYRGLMYKRLREQASFMQASLYSSVVFGITHGNLVQMLFGIVMGMMLAYVYEKYGSVIAPIAAHISVNLFSVLATHFKVFEWLMEDIVRIGTATVICAAVAATMFVFMQRIEEHPEKPGEKENLAAM